MSVERLFSVSEWFAVSGICWWLGILCRLYDTWVHCSCLYQRAFHLALGFVLNKSTIRWTELNSFKAWESCDSRSLHVWHFIVIIPREIRYNFGSAYHVFVCVRHLSLQHFPNKTKIHWSQAYIKKQDKNDTSNYRPVSLLISFSKIFGRVMYNRLYHYINTNHILIMNSLASGRHNQKTLWPIHWWRIYWQH